MKHYFLSIALLFMLSCSFGQNSKNANLSERNLDLIKEFEQQEQERIARIDTYLLKKPNTTLTIKNDTSITQIYDVIDGVVLYRSTDNLNAARSTKTTHLQPGGSLGLNLDGSNMTVGVWDGGPADNTHPEFANSSNSGSRVTIIDNSVVDGDTGYSSHGTHVSGTISAKGVNPNALGMAPNVNIKSYNWTNDESEMVFAANAVTNPILISNHSYGIPIVPDGGDPLDAWWMGAYTQDARDIDNISKNNPKYLIVASAGNSGTTTYSGGLFSGYDKLTTDKNAKNNLVVANANPSLVPFTYELASLTINSSSSQGPTDDLRIKPDIAADGTNLTSPVPGGAYGTLSGTSMASPNTSGTLVLLQQYYNQLNGTYMNSSTLRGLVCHTAVDDAIVGPDPKFGWGFLDAKASAETILKATTNDAIVDELNLAQGATYTFTFSAQAGDKLSATICWTDMPGDIATNGNLNDATPRLVNDLDLKLTKDGVDFLPWKLNYSSSSGFSNSKGDNNVDNIERVDIDAPLTGVYTITVSHKGLLKGNVGGPFDPQTQDFALIVTGNSLTLGVEDNNFANNLIIFPNPNNGEFNIRFDSNINNNDDVKIDIYDISGRLVFKNIYNNDAVQFNKTINLDGVASGVYIANITQGVNTTSHKIIIE
ncbi:S8 family serine peptidase [Winogradskyella eximia]|uniref:S8 family serine peptidase n=1 Tax=Winogradskyella eximia TaxID=262006 RepID=UPI002492D132|nr:S8 family serine peptidase [Winogradskyella eximia]